MVWTRKLTTACVLVGWFLAMVECRGITVDHRPSNHLPLGADGGSLKGLNIPAKDRPRWIYSLHVTMSKNSGLSSEAASKLDEHSQKATRGTALVSDSTAYIGDHITLHGRELPPDEPLDIVWHTARGGWGIVQGNEVIGPQFQHRSEVIDTVSTDAYGTVTHEWMLPEDYGGDHRIELQTNAGQVVAETSVTVVPWFELDTTRVQLGESFTITGYGLGPNAITNNYQIAWDNGVVGFMTGTMNNGTATAEVRAAGPPGDHVLQVWRNLRGIPFLQNNTQSPFGPVAGGRQSVWTVTVEPPETPPEPTSMDSLVSEEPLDSHFPPLDVESDATLGITPTSGQPGTSARLHGRAFPPSTTVDLTWYTHVGNRVAGTPIEPEPREDVLPTVTTDESGAFSLDLTIPNGMGGTRPIVAEVGGTKVAVTGFVMQPDIVTFEPTSGPVGTEIDIELTGIGWPTYENAYFFVYDNRSLGYVCGVDMEKDVGVVRTKLRACGEPGWHFIDVYPSFFETKEELPDVGEKAHLSYQNNHPVRALPAMHLAFEITEQ